VKIDSSSVADDEYARFTANGLESRSTSEVLSDIGAAPAAGDSNIVTTGALNSGSITSGFGAIDNGSSNITTTGVGSFGSLDISGDIDVDGTTNLDNVDIDGTASIAGHASIGVDAVNSNRALTVAGASDGSSSSILVCYNSSLASKFSVRDDGLVTVTGDLVVNGTALATTDTDTSNTGSVTLDFGANQNFVLTLTGNVTLANPSTEQVGQSGFIVFIQDGTGSRTVSLGTDYETASGAGLTLSSAASTTDIVPYVVAASGRVLLGNPQLAFS
jgi:hypothetical protein